MASRNLTQRLAVALCSNAKADKMLACIASRTELPADIKASLEIEMADSRKAREVANAVDTGASLTQKSKTALEIMLASKDAASELIDLLENTATDAEVGTGPAAPVEPPVVEEPTVTADPEAHE